MTCAVFTLVTAPKANYIPERFEIPVGSVAGIPGLKSETWGTLRLVPFDLLLRHGEFEGDMVAHSSPKRA
jgi:hypothetical protein